MSTATVPAQDSGALESEPRVPGRVRVRARVIEKVVLEASAVAVGVPRTEVSVDVSEWGTGLAVRVSARFPVPRLDDTEMVRAAPPILERVRELQVRLASDFSRLTGREIARVSVVVTGAIAPERKRVR